MAALRVGPGARYLPDVLPSAILLGLGLACAVAPLTAAVLAAAPDHLAGAASGINNATARTAGLLAVAVVPVVAGLSTVAPEDANGFDRGFGTAMLVGAGLMATAAIISWVLVGQPAAAPPAADDRLPVHRNAQCPVGAPGLHPHDRPSAGASAYRPAAG